MKLTYWTIMDKSKKTIACGSPRQRSIRLVSSLEKSPVRIILYGTESKAKSGFKDSGFYDETKGYLRKIYGERFDYEEICVAVPLVMEICDE